ncbi:hypothetical protein Ddc_19395 [Ditylenchus destructor]|nr:hypothetical protein Ddc_19395 [Ditylenchus destructor]
MRREAGGAREGAQELETAQARVGGEGGEIDIAGRVVVQTRAGGRDARGGARVEVEHAPTAAMIADGGAVVDLAGVDGDEIARAGLDHAAAARGLLRAAIDQTDAELVVHVPGEGSRGVGPHHLDAGEAAGRRVKGGAGMAARESRVGVDPSEALERRAGNRAEHDDGKRRHARQDQQSEGREREAEVCLGMDGAGPERVVEGGDQEADDARVDAHQRGAHGGAAAQAVPEGERAGDEQERGREDREQEDEAADPALQGRVHDGAEQRQHDVTAAEDEGAGLEEAAQQGEERRAGVGGEKQAEEQRGEERERDRADGTGDGGERELMGAVGRRGLEREEADDRAGDEGAELSEVGDEGEVGDAVAEGDQQDRGGQGEADPRGDGAEPARAEHADGDADLAGSGAGEELAEGDENGVAEVGDRSAEGRQAEAEEGEEDAPGGALDTGDRRERRGGGGRHGAIIAQRCGSAGCLVPHLTRLAALPCEEARQRAILAELSRPSGRDRPDRAPPHISRANTARLAWTRPTPCGLIRSGLRRDQLPPDSAIADLPTTCGRSTNAAKALRLRLPPGRQTPVISAAHRVHGDDWIGVLADEAQADKLNAPWRLALLRADRHGQARVSRELWQSGWKLSADRCGERHAFWRRSPCSSRRLSRSSGSPRSNSPRLPSATSASRPPPSRRARSSCSPPMTFTSPAGGAPPSRPRRRAFAARSAQRSPPDAAARAVAASAGPRHAADRPPQPRRERRRRHHLRPARVGSRHRRPGLHRSPRPLRATRRHRRVAGRGLDGAGQGPAAAGRRRPRVHVPDHRRGGLGPPQAASGRMGRGARAAVAGAVPDAAGHRHAAAAAHRSHRRSARAAADDLRRQRPAHHRRRDPSDLRRRARAQVAVGGPGRRARGPVELRAGGLRDARVRFPGEPAHRHALRRVARAGLHPVISARLT